MLIHIAIIYTTHGPGICISGGHICLSDVLISLSFFMASCRLTNDINSQMQKVLMNKMYLLESLPSYAALLELDQSICFAFDYLCLHPIKTRQEIDLLDAFFADPSRSADFFLGDINAQMAVWSLTTLDQDFSIVASQPLPSPEDETFFMLHHSICAYHLSHASILSPVLVNFPRIGSTKLRIWGGDSDSNCEEPDLDCKKYEDQLPSKAITLFASKECQDSKDQLSKAVTRFLLVC